MGGTVPKLTIFVLERVFASSASHILVDYKTTQLQTCRSYMSCEHDLHNNIFMRTNVDEDDTEI